MEQKIKVLVTGAKGFVGKNLVFALKNKDYDVYEYDKDNTLDDLKNATLDCHFVFHLAGVNRPKNVEEFKTGNADFTHTLLNCLRENKNNCSVLITSSIQAELDNEYGKSKKMAEDIIFEDEKIRNCKNYVFRLPNVFGKWCRPNYNSVIATFCNNVANNLEITINDENKELNLVYIDDVVESFLNAIDDNVNTDNNFCYVPVVYRRTLGDIAKLIYSYKESRINGLYPNVVDEFSKKLYSTYLSYLSEDDFAYNLKSNVDNRGSFTEILKGDNGQISVNIAKPGIIKGNHWHNTKNEKFIVLTGQAVIKFRKVDSDNVIEYKVSGDKLTVVDIPVGYTHNIENIGDSDLIFLIWANEIFDKEKPDTYYLNV